MNKKIIGVFMFTAIAAAAAAQSGTNSPFSQFGLGTLADRSQGFNRGMDGLGQAMRFGNQVNTMNPASYSAVDSLTMLFDVGLSGQVTNFKEGGTKLNAKNSNFEYAVGSFRAFKNVGIGFGVLPFSNIGYKYSTASALNSTSSVTGTYYGKGGIHEVFLGMGWRMFKPLSVGFNAGYLWGSYDRTVTASGSTMNTLTKYYTASVSSYKLDIGVQYHQPLGKKDALTIGATVGVGHSLKTDPELYLLETNSASSAVDTTKFVARDAFKLPMSYAAGMVWEHNNSLYIGADFSVQKWGDNAFPEFSEASKSYVLKDGLLKDRYKGTVGVEWIPNSQSRKFLSHVHYRLGASYATPYYTINGVDGPKEYSVSGGFGIPIYNGYNNRSVLNISGQWVRSSVPNMITENTFRINIGLTFNERWFAKWKVE